MCTGFIVEQQLNFFITFKSEYPNAPISRTTFQSFEALVGQKAHHMEYLLLSLPLGVEGIVG
jgi:hypothetical protein